MQELLFEPNFLYSDGPYTSWEHPMKVIYKKKDSVSIRFQLAVFLFFKHDMECALRIAIEIITSLKDG